MRSLSKIVEISQPSSPMRLSPVPSIIYGYMVTIPAIFGAGRTAISRHDVATLLQFGDLHREVRGIDKWAIGLVISAIAGITAIAVSAVALVAAAMKG